jgi:serine/threonine protein kinase
MARQQIELSSSEVLNKRRDRLTEIERAENHELEALDEEERLANICGWRSGHDTCTSDEFPPCVKPIATERGILGRSAKNEVDEVRMPGFTPVMARKRIFIERGKLAAARDHQQIQAEVRNLRSLNHEHIVKVLGCYAETIGKHQTFCLLIYPAAEEDLSHFLCEGCQPFSEEQKSWIGTWFGCLASALAYMQSQGIHHEDIKPSNIVHCGRHIYFTDFGSSRRLEADQDTSTDTPALASKLFAAPEAMPENGKLMGHGSKTDVYSLGLVYVEILAAYLGNDISQMRDSFFGKSMQVRRYSNVTNKIAEVLGQTDMWHSCLKGMLHPNRQSRPSAQEVVDTLSQDRFRKVVNRCSCQSRQRTNDPMPLIPRQQYIVGMRNWNGRPMSTRYHSDSNFVSAETSQSRRVHNEVHIANQPQARPVSTPMLSTRKGVLPTHSPRLTDIGAYEVYSSEGESAYDEEERPATERGHPGQSSHRVQP